MAILHARVYCRDLHLPHSWLLYLLSQASLAIPDLCRAPCCPGWPCPLFGLLPQNPASPGALWPLRQGRSISWSLKQLQPPPAVLSFSSAVSEKQQLPLLWLRNAPTDQVIPGGWGQDACVCLNTPPGLGNRSPEQTLSATETGPCHLSVKSLYTLITTVSCST